MNDDFETQETTDEDVESYDFGVSERQLRVRALEIAVNAYSGSAPHSIVKSAEEFLTFLRGTSRAK